MAAAALNSLSLMERYEDPNGLVFIFDQIGLGNNERARITNDGLDTLKKNC